MSKRGWTLLGTALPVLALIAVLAWASGKSGGNPGGLGVNDEFGQVTVKTETARGFSLELLDGTAITLAGLRGKVVMLDFWASWCPPCRQEAPTLGQVYREFQGQPVEFVGIDIWDRREDAQDFIDRFNVPYPNGIDTKGTIAIDYGVRGIPEKFFINRQGAVAKKFVGPMSAESLRTALRELLDGEDTQR